MMAIKNLSKLIFSWNLLTFSRWREHILRHVGVVLGFHSVYNEGIMSEGRNWCWRQGLECKGLFTLYQSSLFELLHVVGFCGCLDYEADRFFSSQFSSQIKYSWRYSSCYLYLISLSEFFILLKCYCTF